MTHVYSVNNDLVCPRLVFLGNFTLIVKCQNSQCNGLREVMIVSILLHKLIYPGNKSLRILIKQLNGN